ncbi:MAG: squalene synthase HpnC [Betaproteobacteria bacterium]|nr:squalene synthase HpnC [Betaproteobacteria bacterium]
MPVDHYENFPVASFLLPARLRHPVTLIYHFARRADDFADEGELPDARRLELLDGFREQLRQIERGEAPREDLFRELAPIIDEHGLPIQLFHDLLDAFTQDVTKKRYADFGEVIHYCRRSANPVGRLLLHLYGATEPRNLAYSDGVCSSLQIINFLQDIEIDYRKGRIYLPQDEMARYRIGEAQIARGDAGGTWRPFILFQIERARKMLQSGAPLGKILKGRVGLETRMIILGGETILRKLHETGGDVFRHRPVLKPLDWPFMLYRAVRAR